MVTDTSTPAGAVVPVLIYPDVAAAGDRLCGTFGFEERLRAAGRDGGVSHAQVVVGGDAIGLGAGGGAFHATRPAEGEGE